MLFKALLDGKEIHKALASKDSCKNFVKEYLFSSLLLVIVPFIVVIVNLVSQKVLSVLSSYEKQPTVSQWKWYSIFNMTLLTIVNTGVIILLVNL